MMDIPYFATNKEWFYINEDGRIVLTDKAPPEAVESLNNSMKHTSGAAKMIGFIKPWLLIIISRLLRAAFVLGNKNNCQCARKLTLEAINRHQSP